MKDRTQPCRPIGLVLALCGALAAGAQAPSTTVFAPAGSLDDRPGTTLVREAGAFDLYRVTDDVLRDLPAELAGRVRSAEGTDRLLFDAGALDTRAAETPAPDSGSGLQLVQFAGPVRDAWLDRLRAAGAEPIHYVAHRGYLVWVDDAARAELAALAADGRVLRYTAPFAATPRLGPNLRRRLADPLLHAADATVDVVVQRVARPGAPEAVASDALLDALDRSPGGGAWTPVLRFENRHAAVRLGDVERIARLPDVTWVGERLPRELFDEVQAQLVAGAFDGTGSGPAGPGYKAFLDGLGFSQDPADYPIVDITDSGVGLGTVDSGDPTLHRFGNAANPTRLAYVVNCTLEADGGGEFDGHGHINASIAGGFDLRAGFPFRDPDGYQRGLGINPYGRLASTRVFEPFGFELRSCGDSDAELIRGLQDRGARIASNSWGCAGCAETYDDSSQAFDAGVRDADPFEPGNQELTFVFAAGNSGPVSETIGSPGNGKNMITVGASENVRPEDEDGPWLDGCLVFPSGADDAMDIIDFSSRGPAPGGRIKPDIVAPGTHVHGTANPDGLFAIAPEGVCDPFHPSGQEVFAASSGTSHSTPAISGLLSLVTWWLENDRGGTPVDSAGGSPSPALLKAYLLAHTTYLTGEYAGDTLPSRAQGYGMPAMDQLFDTTPELYHDQGHVFTDSGGTWRLLASVADSSKPVRIVLAYTDAPGLIGTSPQVNDLDLVATVDGTLYRGNVFDGRWTIAGGSADAANNTEAIFLPPGFSGDIEITVSAFNIAGDGVPHEGDGTDQDFALVCDNCAARPSFTLDVTPSTAEVCAPADAVFTVDVGARLGFSSPVDLAVTGAPAGTTTGWSIDPVTPPGTAQLTLGDTGSATPGVHGLELTGSTGGVSHARQALLVLADAVPSAPTLVSPADGVTDVELRPDLAWTAVAGARRYEVELATDAAFVDVVHAVSVDEPTYPLTIFQLEAGRHPYHWRARAVNPCGPGPWSAPSTFETLTLPGVLVVDDDGGFPDMFGYYAEALDALGVPYDVKGPGIAGEPTYYELAPYHHVIWFVGRQWLSRAGPGSAAEKALARYLDEGGSLFVSAQDWILVRGRTDFMADYLGVGGFVDDVDHASVTGVGPYFAGFGSHVLDYPYTNQSDRLLPDATAQTVLSGNQGSAGLYKTNGSYRTMFWGVSFEALPSPAVRADAMRRILESLGRDFPFFADGFETGDFRNWDRRFP